MNMDKQIVVWDIPVRIFHWLLVLCFAGAWLSAESEKYQLIHYAFGYTAGALVLFRIIWGFVGTKYARFYNFLKGPKAIVAHTKQVLSGQHSEKYAGHNPAGAVVMVLLMLLILAIVLTGYWNVKELFGDAAEELHEGLANIMLAIVGLHVTAAIVMSFLEKQNLVKSMVTGKKEGPPTKSIRSQKAIVGFCLLLAVVIFFWATSTGLFPTLVT
jgi:cytochrome b